jgi:hypothetical protein
MLIHTTSIKSEVITTNNLLDKNFDAGSWSGSADGRHGSNTIAAEHDTYIQSNDISVKNDANLTELQLQNGFTANHQFEYWHWNTYESNVKSTVTITGADGETTTQIRNYASDSCGSNNCGSFSVGSDTNIVLRNVQTDYDLSVRYDFTDTSNATNTHNGVDLKEPSLTLTYQSQPVELEVQNTIQDLFEDFKIEEDLKFEEKFKMVEFKEEPMVMKIKEEPIIEEFFEIMSIPQDKPKMKEQKEIIEQPIMAEKPKEEITTDQLIANAKKEEMPKETIEEEVVEEDEKFTKVNSEISQKEKGEETKKEVATEEPKEKIKTKIASTKTNKKKLKIHEVMANVDAQVKDISKNLIIKNIIKLDAMQENQASLLVYNNAEFYQSKYIYLQQLDIFDNRDIYVTVNLTKYIDNDIMQVKIKKLNDIQYKKRILLLELQELKNG